MIRILERRFRYLALLTALVVCAPAVIHAQSITFIGSTTGSDYSDAGLDLGNFGFWFAQFDAVAPVSGAAIDNNDRDSLPASG